MVREVITRQKETKMLKAGRIKLYASTPHDYNHRRDFSKYDKVEAHPTLDVQEFRMDIINPQCRQFDQRWRVFAPDPFALQDEHEDGQEDGGEGDAQVTSPRGLDVRRRRAGRRGTGGCGP